MSTTPYYQQGAITNIAASSGRGAALKAAVAGLVAMDPMLSIYSVERDEGAYYDAYIKIAGTQDYIRIYNTSSNSNYIYVSLGVFDATGKWVAISSSSSSYAISTGHSICPVSWGLGNCLRYIAISSNYNGGRGTGVVYGFFDTPTFNSTIACTGAFSYSGSAFPGISAISALPLYWYNPDIGASEEISYDAITPNTSITLSGYDYSLCPINYNASTATKGFVNLRWGGSHKLYKLYNGATAVTAQPGKTVTINGISVMSVGQVIYAV